MRSHATATDTSSYTSSPRTSPGETCGAANSCSRTSRACPCGATERPSFSITDWSIPILRELGFAYDSSAFPTFAHDRYGSLARVAAGKQVVELEPGFHEICVSCLMVGSRGLPWGGGGYFRLMPYGIFRRGVARILRSGEPYVFYIHPWEIDPDQPRVSGLSRLHEFRHYVGLARAETRFKSLLEDFRWTSVADVLAGSEATFPVSGAL